MAKIETTLPTVQYGNVKVTFTPEELGVDISDAAAIGVATAVYLNLFTQGFKAGSQMDVSAPVSASREAPEESFQGAVETAQKEAQRLLDEGLGGVTELPEYEVGDKVTVGGIEFTKHSEVPWDQKVDAKPKPWETDQVTAPAALDATW